jgi:type II secretory pathway component PulJ
LARLGPYDTQWLTRASFEPTAARRLRRLLLPVVVALVIGASAGGFYVDARLPALSRTAEFERRNASLAAELDRARVELEMERATRDEVQRHAEELSARVTELAHQLEFLNSRGASPGPAGPPQVAIRE